METSKKNFFKRPGLILLASLATLIWAAGCAAPKSPPDPLAGFYPDALYTPDTNKTITADYKDYIQALSPDEQKFIAGIEFF